MKSFSDGDELSSFLVNVVLVDFIGHEHDVVLPTHFDYRFETLFF